MIANYHTHTWRCDHAEPGERLYVERAIEGGLKILGFSDHTPYPTLGSYFRMSPDQLEGYVDTVEALKKEYEKDIEIHLGLEVEYYPDLFEGLLAFLADFPLEYMILGQHFLGNETGPYSGAATDSVNTLHAYVDQVIEALNRGCFTYLAHPDLINFVGSKAVYQEEMKRICAAARETNTPLELNFLGFADHRNYPNPAFWEVVGTFGNDVILGCDAHRTKDTFQPETEAGIRREYVEKYGLHLIDRCDLVPIHQTIHQQGSRK